MVFNWHLYNWDMQFIEEVYMTEAEFSSYVANHPTAFFYKKYKAGENWQ